MERQNGKTYVLGKHALLIGKNCCFSTVIIMQVFVQPFKIAHMRKHPNLETTDDPYSVDSFVWRETGRENMTFIFTRGPYLWNPILIISNADYRIEDINIPEKNVMLRVLTDDEPYAMYFNDQDAILRFLDRLWTYALKA